MSPKNLLPILFLAICNTSLATDGCTISALANSQLLNVSTAGWATKDEPLIACTVLDPDVSAENGFAFFSETTTEDAFIEVKYVDKPFPQRIADNWNENLSETQKLYLSRLLRIPGKETDAALIIHSDRTYYQNSGFGQNRFGVCAYGYPKSGRAWTSVSISSLRRNACFNMPRALFFER